MSLGWEGNQSSLCLQMSATLLWVPPTTSTLWTGLIVYPTHWEGVEAESEAATKDVVSGEETALSVCLPVCLPA